MNDEDFKDPFTGDDSGLGADVDDDALSEDSEDDEDLMGGHDLWEDEE